MENRILRPPEKLYEGYVFDLDGTIHLGHELLRGAEWLTRGRWT